MYMYISSNLIIFMIFETIVLSVIVVGLSDLAASLTGSVVVRNVFLHLLIAS